MRSSLTSWNMNIFIIGLLPHLVSYRKPQIAQIFAVMRPHLSGHIRTQWENRTYLIATQTKLNGHSLSEANSALRESRHVTFFYGTRKFIVVFTSPATVPHPQSDESNPHSLTLFQFWIRNDVQENGQCLILGAIPKSAWKDRGKTQKHSVRIDCLRAKIWTLNLPNSKQEH
jgi:hypothetical protein